MPFFLLFILRSFRDFFVKRAISEAYFLHDTKEQCRRWDNHKPIPVVHELVRTQRKPISQRERALVQRGVTWLRAFVNTRTFEDIALVGYQKVRANQGSFPKPTPKKKGMKLRTRYHVVLH